MTFEEYKNENYPNGCIVNILYGRGANIEMPLKHAFETSATENGIQWHDLRKDPNDIPNNYRYVVAVFYDCIHDERKSCIARLREDSEWEVNGWAYSNVIAWCEIPQFKE